MARKSRRNRSNQDNQRNLEKAAAKAIEEQNYREGMVFQFFLLPSVVGLLFESWWVALITLILSGFLWVYKPITCLIVLVAFFFAWGIGFWYMGHAVGGDEGGYVLAIIGFSLGYVANIDDIRDRWKQI